MLDCRDNVGLLVTDRGVMSSGGRDRNARWEDLLKTWRLFWGRICEASFSEISVSDGGGLRWEDVWSLLVLILLGSGVGSHLFHRRTLKSGRVGLSHHDISLVGPI